VVDHMIDRGHQIAPWSPHHHERPHRWCHLDLDRARGAVATVRRMIASVAAGKCGFWRGGGVTPPRRTTAPKASARQRTTRAGWPVRRRCWARRRPSQEGPLPGRQRPARAAWGAWPLTRPWSPLGGHLARVFSWLTPLTAAQMARIWARSDAPFGTAMHIHPEK
jgi:hypothetical protein